MAKSESPDLVLMDMNMPVLDGWRASQIIRSDPTNAALPIIGLTAACPGERSKKGDRGGLLRLSHQARRFFAAHDADRDLASTILS